MSLCRCCHSFRAVDQHSMNPSRSRCVTCTIWCVQLVVCFAGYLQTQCCIKLTQNKDLFRLAVYVCLQLCCSQELFRKHSGKTTFSLLVPSLLSTGDISVFSCVYAEATHGMSVSICVYDAFEVFWKPLELIALCRRRFSVQAKAA